MCWKLEFVLNIYVGRYFIDKYVAPPGLLVGSRRGRNINTLNSFLHENVPEDDFMNFLDECLHVGDAANVSEDLGSKDS